MADDPKARYCQCGSRIARDNPDTLCAPCRKRTQDGLHSPPLVPTGFWDDGQLRSAFASWHMGHVVHAYRHHPFHGPRPLPQELVAGWLGITQAQLSRVETGPPPQDLDRLIRWAQTLDVPRHLLWFKLPRQPPTHPQADATQVVLSRQSEAAGPAQTPPRPRPEARDVRRDQFLVLAGSTLAGMLAPPLVHGWRDRTAPPAQRLDDVFLAQTRAQTEGFRWLDRKEGAHAHLPATIRHARSLASFWQATDKTHPLRPQLAEAAADACHLVAYQAFDQGGRTLATEWYRCSAELAAHAASRDLYVFSVCGVAFMHANNGDATLALSVLDQLLSLSLSAAAQCYVAVYQAHAHAKARELDLALRALDWAATYAEQTKQEPPSSWLGILDSAFVERQRAIILARFGLAEAIVLMERLDRNTPAVFRRYRVTLATYSALTYAHTKQVDRSAQRLTTALVLNRTTQSVEKTRQILGVRVVLNPYQDSKAVKAVDEVIHATVAKALAAPS